MKGMSSPGFRHRRASTGDVSPQPVAIHVSGASDDDEKDEGPMMVLTRQQNNERFLKKTRAKQSQVSKLTEQLEDLKWQLFYGNSEKDKEVKQMRHALVLKDQELEELRGIQLSALSAPLAGPPAACYSASTSSSSSSSLSSSSSSFFSSSSSSPPSSLCSSDSPPQAEVTQLYGAIVQVLQHQGLLMRRLSCAPPQPLHNANSAVADRLDLIERDVNAQISAVLADHVSASAPSHVTATSATSLLAQHSDNVAILLQKVDLLLAKEEAEAARKEEKRLRKERERQLGDGGWFSEKRILVFSFAAACLFLSLLSTNQNIRPRST
jgi:hypothetical protein